VDSLLYALRVGELDERLLIGSVPDDQEMQFRAFRLRTATPRIKSLTRLWWSNNLQTVPTVRTPAA
jgi:hypothetical protein